MYMILSGLLLFLPHPPLHRVARNLVGQSPSGHSELLLLPSAEAALYEQTCQTHSGIFFSTFTLHLSHTLSQISCKTTITSSAVSVEKTQLFYNLPPKVKQVTTRHSVTSGTGCLTTWKKSFLSRWKAGGTQHPALQFIRRGRAGLWAMEA